MEKLSFLVLVLFTVSCYAQETLVWQDEFDFLDESKWQHFVTGWDGGNDEFQYYRNNRKNTYVRDGILYIMPTLTADEYGESFIYDGELDLTQEGCLPEMDIEGGCHITTNGPDDIVNPIQSARMRSNIGFSFTYGRVEIRAQTPKGDWLWPALWMLPQNDVYGGWPRSGEMDIMESKGNINYLCYGNWEGHQKMGSTMHWGPDYSQNRYDLTTWSRTDEANPYGDGFHVFGMEWDENHVRFTVDGTLTGEVYPPDGGFWELGEFHGQNIWESGSKMAPFDQDFHFILNVAIGGNYFSDDPNCVNAFGAKPWVRQESASMKKFWEARDAWKNTWTGEDAAMKIDYIRVYQ